MVFRNCLTPAHTTPPLLSGDVPGCKRPREDAVVPPFHPARWVERAMAAGHDPVQGAWTHLREEKGTPNWDRALTRGHILRGPLAGLFTFRQLFPTHQTHLGPIRQNTQKSDKFTQIRTLWGPFLKFRVIFWPILIVFGQKICVLRQENCLAKVVVA